MKVKVDLADHVLEGFGLRDPSGRPAVWRLAFQPASWKQSDRRHHAFVRWKPSICRQDRTRPGVISMFAVRSISLSSKVLVNDRAAAIRFDDHHRPRQPVLSRPPDRQHIDAVGQQFRHRPFAVGVIANGCRKIDLQFVRRTNGGRGDRQVGGWATKALVLI